MARAILFSDCDNPDSLCRVLQEIYDKLDVLENTLEVSLENSLDWAVYEERQEENED